MVKPMLVAASGTISTIGPMVAAEFQPYTFTCPPPAGAAAESPTAARVGRPPTTVVGVKLKLEMVTGAPTVIAVMPDRKMR